MKPFEKVTLLKRNKFLEFLKIFPDVNVSDEVNNYFAKVDIPEVKKDDVDKILEKYRKNIKIKQKEKFEAILQKFADHYFSQDLPNEGVNSIYKMEEILGIDNKSSIRIITKAKEQAYQKRFEKEISAGQLTEASKELLEELRQNFSISIETADELAKNAISIVINSLVNSIIEDGEVSPEEDATLEETINNLSAKLTMDLQTKKRLDTYRKLWKINHVDLPVFEPPIILQKREVCYYAQPVDWYETRSVRHHVNYGGTTARIRIAKGIYYRLGSLDYNNTPTQELTFIDSGIIYITNKRTIFTGSKKNVAILFSRILNLVPYKDGVDIIKDSGKTPFLSFKDDVEIFTAVLHRAISDNL